MNNKAPKPKPKAQTQTQIKSNINRINYASKHDFLPRKLTNHRKGPKSVNNISFTTTIFDRNRNVAKTVISTNDKKQKQSLANNIPPKYKYKY